MHHSALRNVLMSVPIAVAVLVALAMPGASDRVGMADDGAAQQEAYARCRAESALLHAGTPGSAPTTGPRTQSPAWLQQREAALTHCLQVEWHGARQASAR